MGPDQRFASSDGRSRHAGDDGTPAIEQNLAHGALVAF
jgi:hypothetical protein